MPEGGSTSADAPTASGSAARISTSDGGRWRLASLVPLPQEAVAGLVRALPIDVVAAERSDAGVRAALAEADLCLGDWSGELRVDAAAIAGARRLAFVQQPAVGVEVLDVDALAQAGIPAANVGSANAVSVAEWCVGATLAALRSMVWADRQVRAGEWPTLELSARGASELAGKRVGVVGFGSIGQLCAQRYSAFGAHVSYWSRRQRPAELEHGAVFVADIDELTASTDVLVLVIPHTPETRGLFAGERLARLPRGAVVVNAARGGIVDEAALAELLESGHLAAAAFDVFESEPPAPVSPLLSSDRTVLYPHAAGASTQSVFRIFQAVTDNLGRAVRGEPVNDVVNGVDPVVRRRP